MNDDAPAEFLQLLLDACHDGRRAALRLAEHTEIEALRDFLYESAQQYRRAAEDIRTVWKYDVGPLAPLRRAPSGRIARIEGDVVSAWERAECETLTYFRDAYDARLPAPLAETVRRHYETAVTRLERLRHLQERLDQPTAAL